MTITLGYEPYSIEVVLARDSVFTTAIVADEPWPAGIAVELRFAASDAATPTVWPAQVDTSTLTWDVPSSDVAEVLDARASHVRLMYKTAEGETLLWAKGRTRSA